VINAGLIPLIFEQVCHAFPFISLIVAVNYNYYVFTHIRNADKASLLSSFTSQQIQQQQQHSTRTDKNKTLTTTKPQYIKRATLTIRKTKATTTRRFRTSHL